MFTVMASLKILSAIVLLMAVGIPTLGPFLIKNLLFISVHPWPWDSSQERYMPVVGPYLHANKVRGKPTHSFVTSAQVDYVEHEFKHRPGDVWVITFQKAGTTWAQYIVNLINGQPPQGLLEIMNTCPWVEVEFGIFGQGSSSSKAALEASAEKTSGPPRCFKSHWPRSDHVAKLPADTKIIYVVRDAESVASSYFAHVKRFFMTYWLEDDEVSWDSFFEQFITGESENGDFFEHVASWWALRSQPNVLFMNFQDMVKDPAGAVQNISVHMGVELAESRLIEIVSLTSADAMWKSLEADPAEKVFAWAGALRGEHVRKGEKKVSYVTASQRQRLKERYEAVLKPIGVPQEWIYKQK